ncbi:MULTISPECIES: hypothetical protein [Halocynthiibacter]|uniref:DUF2125 domain-containing protein n=1 Tax=Halocynthiibacter halioticoli TaxID=2986804 RepID=A0AAE3J4E0_9RHOB|nr:MULTISPECIES: hypothetical protein [Halocynthiibacter]MCV6825692.1 hypothetical protein [Halocynthiibacter halioticoli]MCW4058693.1 hypothetical protein [Halocynthiibacter sp. SDUM655004]
MSFIRKFTTTSALCALLSSPALADVTADDVWEGLQAQYTMMGYQAAATNVTRDGNKLIIDDFVLSMEIPEEDETLKVSGINLVLEELANGTVDIQFPDELTINAEVADVIVELLLTLTEDSIVASGNPDDMTFAMSVENYIIDLKQIREGDVAFLPKAIITMTGLAGDMRVAKGGMTELVYDMTSDSLNIDVDFEDPEGDGQFTALLNLTGVTADSTSTIPNDVDMTNIADALAQGMKSDGAFGYSGATFNVKVVDEQEGADISGSSQSGSFGFQMSEAGIGYNTASTNTDLTVIPAVMPLPLKFQIAETASQFLFPISKSDAPQDAKIMMKYAGLTLDEAIWGMFDPGSVLPRTPATILMDLSAQVSWDLDLLDPANAEALEGSNFPGKLYSANINDIQIAAAGAEFTGNGAFTFNNDDLETFDGLPAPDGEINLKLTGGNGLLDKLIQMGFVKEEDAMGIRMMSGLFANAGEGDDELVSKIEVKPNGNVLANGTRIK